MDQTEVPIKIKDKTEVHILGERKQNGSKTKPKMVKLLSKNVSISAINDDSKSTCARYASKYLITMVTNVNTYVWTVIYACL